MMAQKTADWPSFQRFSLIRTILQTSLACLLAFQFCQVQVAAQENPPAATVPPAEAKAPAERPVDHLIYIPYERLSDVIDRFKSKVVLSYAEYLELMKRAEQATQEGPASVAVMTSANYQAAVSGETATITATFQCQSLVPKWGRIPISLGDAAVGEVSAADGKKVILQGNSDGNYTLLFPEAGDYTITLKLLKKITQSPSGPALELTVPTTGVTTFELTVPKSSQKVTISPRHIQSPVAEPAAEGQTKIAVSLGAVEKIVANWVPDMSDRPEMELLTNVTNNLEITIADGLIHTQAKLAYRVLRGELQSLQIVVAPEDRILDLTSSSRLQGWTVAKEENRQVITVNFLSPVLDQCTIDLHTERSLPEGPLALAGVSEDGKVSGIHSLDVTREQGQLQLQTGEELMMIVNEQSGLVRSDLGEQNASKTAYRYFSRNFSFIVQVKPVEPIVDVQQDTVFAFREQRIDVSCYLNYRVTKAGIFQLPVQLPDQFELLGVSSPAMSEYQYDSASKKLNVLLKERTQGDIAVVVRGRVPLSVDAGDTGEASLENLPQLIPQNVRQDEGRLIAATIEAIELIANEEQIKNAQAIPTDGIPHQIPDAQIRAVWQYQTRPVTIPVRLLRRPTRLISQTASSIQVQPAGIRVSANIDFVVQFAGIDTFRIAVQKSVSDRTEIEIANNNSVPIQQQSKAPLDENSPWMIWTIQTQRPVTGRQQFRITYEIPYSASLNTVDKQDAVQPPLSLLLPYPLGGLQKGEEQLPLSRSTGEVVVQNDPALSVGVQGSGEGLEPIDVRELTLLARDGHQAYRYASPRFEDPILLNLAISRYEVAQVISTVVARSLCEFVVGKSADISIRSQMVIRTSQRQRLMIQLPESAQPMVVQIDGETRQLQRGDASQTPGWTNYVVNVSRSKDSSENFVLLLQYLMQSNPISTSTMRGGLLLPVPRLLNAPGSQAVVQETRCIVWIPKGYVPVSARSPYERWGVGPSGTPFDRLTPDTHRVGDQQQWLTSSAPVTTFPTEGDAYVFTAIGAAEDLQLTYWNRKGVTVLMTLLLVGIAFVLMKTTWSNRILVGIVTATVLAVVLQYSPEIVGQSLVCARYGLLALAGIWIVQGALQCRDTCYAGYSNLVELTRKESPPVSESPEDAVEESSSEKTGDEQ
ncbi:MAG: hypothetical protein KDA78_01425 [Planctomycetaceae bacterium]|nr:hypothetical protein [Planctomycetaceae bacterium]